MSAASSSSNTSANSEKWNPSWESAPIYIAFFSASTSQKLERFKVTVNNCRGVPKLNIERVHIRPKADANGVYRSAVTRVFGNTNHIRLEIDQGVSALERVAELLAQLRKDEKVVVNNVTIIVKEDEVELERKYLMPNVKPVRIIIPFDIATQIITDMPRITAAARQINESLNAIFENASNLQGNNNGITEDISDAEEVISSGTAAASGSGGGGGPIDESGKTKAKAGSGGVSQAERDYANVAAFRREYPNVLCNPVEARFDDINSGGMRVVTAQRVPAKPVNEQREPANIITPQRPASMKASVKAAAAGKGTKRSRVHFAENVEDIDEGRAIMGESQAAQAIEKD